MPVITNIEDLRVLAQKRVPRMFYDYADSGSWTESTYRANESDFQKIKLRQRVAVNMENRSTHTTMIGQKVAMPVAIAPTGLTGMQHADGEIKAAKAAKRFGIPFTLSTMSICSIEDVAKATIACVHNPEVCRKAIPIGGLKPISQLDAVSLVEQATGRTMQVEFMTADQIAGARKGTTDALTGSFLGLFDSLARGDEIPAGWSETLGVKPQSLEDWFSTSQK